MKRRLEVVGFLLFAGLACTWMVIRTVSAQPPYGGPVPMKAADLVITRIEYRGFVGAPKPYPCFRLTVKNIGNAASTQCYMWCGLSRNFTDPPISGTHGTVPALEPGQTWNSSDLIVWLPDGVSTDPFKGMILAAVDAPATDKPHGQVAELAGELNNVFGFTFSIAKRLRYYQNPITWSNPAVP